MIRPLLLGVAILPLLCAAPALALAQTPPVPAQTPDATHLNQLESEYADVMNEAQQLGSGRTIDESIRFSTNRQGQLRVDLERLEEAIQRQGGAIEELEAARRRFADQSVFGLREAGEEITEEAATHVAASAFSVVFRRVLGVVTLVGDVVTYGGRKIIKELNVSDMEDLVRQGRLQRSDMVDMYSVMNAELIAEIRAQQRLRELQPRQRALFGQIAEERARLELLGAPARSRARLDRDPDAAGDRALQAEEDRERLERGVRLSDPAEDARRREERRRGGRGVTPVSSVPGLGLDAPMTDQPPWRPGDPSFVFYAGASELNAPTESGTGFQRADGGTETFAGRNLDTIRMRVLGVMLYPLAYRAWLISASGLYGKGDEQSEGSVPDGTGTDTGFVYGDFSPGGSTGVNVGDRGSAWTTNSEVETLNFKFKMVRAATTTWTWFVYADYLLSRRRYDNAVMAEVFVPGGDSGCDPYCGPDDSPSGPDVTYLLSQERNQEVTDNLIGAGAGLQFDSGPGDGVRFGGWTSAGLFHRSSELSAWERNVCPLCGPDDQDFTLRFDDEDSGVTWSAAVGVFAELPLTDRISVGASLDAAYIDEVGAVFNPSSGDQVFIDNRTTALTTADAFTYGVKLGVRMSF